MIRSIEIHNFKAFERIALRFGQLTMIAGVNSSGKSSVLQAIALAEIASTTGPGVQLNGSLGLALGEAQDVLNHRATEQFIELITTGDTGTDTFRLAVPQVDRSVVLERIDVDPRPGSRDWYIGTYLCAERLGPRDLSEVPSDGADRVDVGTQGQFTAYALARFSRHRVQDLLLHPSSSGSSLARTLKPQSEAWLSSIVRPVQLEADWIQQANAATLRFRDTDVTSEWKRPANVGFGLTYSLPIIAAALGSAAGSVFIVENPEAHLHPAGQSEIGRFLVRLAATGVQVVIETHSDHVLNGIRLAVTDEGLLAAKDVAIHFLGPNESEVTEIALGSTGALDVWPSGFFDRAEHDLAALSRIRRRG